MYTYFGESCIELNITRKDAESMSHQGDCEQDVRALLPKYRNQLRKKSLNDLRDGIIECGIERERVKKMDEEEVFIYVLWIASGDIVQEIYAR
jgi:hypothetical protein